MPSDGAQVFLRLPPAPLQKPLEPSRGSFWGGESLFPSHLMMLVTSEGFHGDKTTNPGGLGEIGQITALGVLSYTLELGRTL